MKEVLRLMEEDGFTEEQARQRVQKQRVQKKQLEAEDVMSKEELYG